MPSKIFTKREALKMIAVLFVLFTILFNSGCGGSTRPTATNLSIMAPLFALTSPVASSAGSGPNYSTIVSDITARVTTQRNADQCYSNISITPVYSGLLSFGRAIGYDNHPNGAATIPATGTYYGCPIGAATGCLVNGDVGAWSNNESTTSNEAALVAQSNFLTNEIGYIINNALKFTAGTVCAAQLGGTAMPAIGVTTDVSKVAQDSMLQGTISGASVGHLADLVDGKATYTVYTNVAQGPIRYVIFVTHSTTADQTAFKGHIYGYVDIDYSSFSSAAEFPTTKDRKGFSVVYDFQAGVLKIAYEGLVAPTTVTTFLDSNGYISYTAYLAGTYPNYRDTRSLISQITVATGAGTAYYGWHTKPTDTYAKLLKIEATTTTGFAYFGFGPKPTVAGYGSTLGGMFCNWAGPGASLGAYQTTNVQSQTFTLASGIFGSTVNNITYAPTNTCNTAGGTFKYGTSSTYAGAAVGPTVNNNLVTQTTNGTITAITAPVYP